MKPGNIFAITVFAALISCSPKPTSVSKEESPQFKCSASYSINEREENLKKYGNFRYHIRPVGAPEYFTFPAPVVKRELNQMTVTADIQIPYPRLNEDYEGFFSYTLDGKYTETSVSIRPMVSDATSARRP